MRCDRCGHTAPALKTVCWRRDHQTRFALCDSCWEPLAAAVWVIPGLAACFGTCRGCAEWFSVRELEDRTGGGKRDAPSGICARCAV